MTSRTRKSKARVLLSLGKGIASSLAAELAMLFCHAGCEVKIALLDNGHEWVSESAIRQISGSAPLTATHRPGWFFSQQQFDLAIAVSPASLTQQLLQARLTSDPIIEFIMQKSPMLWLLQDPAQIPADHEDGDTQLFFRALPAQPQQLSPFYQKIFSECIAWLAARRKLNRKTFWLNYQVPEPLKVIANNRPAWLARFDRALQSCGLGMSDDGIEADMVISAYDGPQFDADNRLVFVEPTLPDRLHHRNGALFIVFVAPEIDLNTLTADKNLFLVQRRNNALHVADSHGIRAIPDLTGQCCYTRFCSQLITHLSRAIHGREQQS